MQPNILYIHSHDTGRYIQPYGYQVPTPNLQRLAEQGVMFRQAFCANPTCSPSRACLLTGQYAHTNGMLGLSHRGFSLNDYSQHMLHTLRAAGYYAALSGIQHIDWVNDDIASYGSRIGYDTILDLDDMGSKWDHSMAHIRAAEFLRSKKNQPFFLSVGFSETHRAFPLPGEEDDSSYCQPPELFADTPETREEWAGYCMLARNLDAKIGHVLAALEESGQAENTLVICTTDHGIAYPRMKCTLTDGGIGVFLLMRGPGGFTGGRVIDSMVSHIDIFPTICELCSLPAPEWLQGTSILPLIREETDTIREEVFAEVNYHAAYEPQRCVRTNTWKYIRRYEESRRAVLSNCDDGPSKSLWMEQGWADEPLPEEELYNCLRDPRELNNLVDDKNCADILTEMRNKLDTWMNETDDPLLKGTVPAPAGALVTAPGEVSAEGKLITIA